MTLDSPAQCDGCGRLHNGQTCIIPRVRPFCTDCDPLTPFPPSLPPPDPRAHSAPVPVLDAVPAPLPSPLRPKSPKISAAVLMALAQQVARDAHDMAHDLECIGDDLECWIFNEPTDGLYRAMLRAADDLDAVAMRCDSVMRAIHDAMPAQLPAGSPRPCPDGSLIWGLWGLHEENKAGAVPRH